MKTTKMKKLQLSKIAISRITNITLYKIQGGFTDTISEIDDNTNLVTPRLYRMTENPDENGICYAER